MARSSFKTLDHAQVQGVGRRKNAAYKGVCYQCQGQSPLTLTQEGHNTATCPPMADWVLDGVLKPLRVMPLSNGAPMA
jgi:hypothetical protein